MKKSIVFSTVCAVIVFIITFAVLCPNITCAQYIANGSAADVATPSEGAIITYGSIEAGGEVTVSDQMACVIEFPVTEDTGVVRCVEVNFANGYAKDGFIKIECTADGSFTDTLAVSGAVVNGDKFCCAQLEPKEYSAVRIWIETDCIIENVSFYSEDPSVSEISIKISIWRYIATAAITIIALVVAFLIDKKFGVCKKICKYFKEKYLKICTFIIGCGSAIIIGLIIEIIYRLTTGSDSIGNNFNTASCVSFCAVLLCAFVIFFERKNLSNAPEKAMFFIILIAGATIILTQSFGHNGWDIDTHYPLAVQNSYYKTAYYTQSDIGIKTNLLFGTINTLQESTTRINELNDAGRYVVQAIDGASSGLAQKPSGIFIAVARLFGANFYTRYLAGEFANLIVYAVVCYFAVRKLRSGKMVVAAIAMFPTNIFIASSYAYDHWVTAFMLLGTCYFVSECEQPDKPITILETIVMCGAFAIGSLPKQIYILMMALPIFMRKNWEDKKARRNYYLILTACFVTVFAMLVMRSMFAVSSFATGDTRGGAVNPSEQVMYILSSPLEYAKILFNFLLEYLSLDGMQGYTTFLAYLGNGSTTLIFQLVLLFVIITGKNGERHNCPWWIRVLAILLYVGMAALMATALYIDFTPLKSDVILGCQPRYLIPLLAPIGLTLFGSGIRVFKNKMIYNGVVLGVLCAATLFDIINLVAIPMM